MIARLVALLIALACAMAPGFAQDTRREVKLLVIGDVLSAGLGAGLQRVAPPEGMRFTVELRFKEDSGLARPEIHDWQLTLAGILEARNFDAAVVMIGANDAQPIRGEVEKLEFGDPRWEAAYADKVDALAALLKARGVRLFWVGLPPMQAQAYDQSIRTITRIQKERVIAQGGVFVDTRAEFGDAEGNFRDSLPDAAGVARRVRTRDGVRFLKPGNTILASLVSRTISAEPVALAKSTDAAADPQETVGGPAFGQDAPAGADNVLRPDLPSEDELKAANADSEEGPGEPVLSPRKPRPPPKPGSAAARLFSEGVWPEPPAGRFDDVRAGR